MSRVRSLLVLSQAFEGSSPVLWFRGRELAFQLVDAPEGVRERSLEPVDALRAVQLFETET